MGMPKIVDARWKCPRCQSYNDDRLARCWLCHADRLAGVADAELDGPYGARAARMERTDGWVPWVVLGVLLLVAFGAWHDSPGLAILVLVLFGPAVARLLLQSNRSRRLGTSLTILGMIGGFLVSVIATSIIIAAVSAVTVLAMVISLLAVCFSGRGF